MDSVPDQASRRIADLVAHAPEGDQVVLYRMCAYCRELHSGWCFADLLESDAACPAHALIGADDRS